MSTPLLSGPPWDGIRLSAALREFGLSNHTLWKLIEAGKIRAQFDKDRKKGAPVLVSRRDCQRFTMTWNSRGSAKLSPPPLDGEPIGSLASDLNIPDETIRRWCRWSTHPALGRKLRHGFGAYVSQNSKCVRNRLRGLLVSRSDTAACVEAMRRPLHRRFPGQSGEWIAEHIFRDEHQELWFTDYYIAAHYSIAEGTLSLRFYRRLLERQEVTRGGGLRRTWKVSVTSESSLKKLFQRRQGKTDGGSWLVPRCVWREGKDTWYSARHLAQVSDRSLPMMRLVLREKGWRSKAKAVPSGTGGAPTVVYPASLVESLLDASPPEVPGPALPEANESTPACGPQAPGTTKGRRGPRKSERTRQIYSRCYELMAAGDSRRAILRKLRDEFPEPAYLATLPKDEPTVTIYARRWATDEENGLPWPVSASRS